jgi:hypothetical protein
MQGRYPFAFEREMGCTEAELHGWLPGASRGRDIEWRQQGADIALDGGVARIDWQPLSPRRIALIVLPRLHVRFEAHGVDDAAWQRFVRYFDLYTQRGGG